MAKTPIGRGQPVPPGLLIAEERSCPHPLIPSNHDNWQEMSSRPQASHHRGPHGGVWGQQLSLDRCCMPPDRCCRGSLMGDTALAPKGASRGRDGAGCWGCGEGRDGSTDPPRSSPASPDAGGFTETARRGCQGGGLP